MEGDLESLSDYYYKASLEKEVRSSSPQLPCATRIVGSQCRQSKSPYRVVHKGRHSVEAVVHHHPVVVLVAEELLNIK